MKRKHYFELDESSDFALSIVGALETEQPPHDTPIAVPALKLYNLAVKYLQMYDNINQGRSTFVDKSKYIH